MTASEEHLKNFDIGVVSITYGDFYENNKYIRNSKVKALACYKRAMDLKFGGENFYRMKCEVLLEKWNEEKQRVNQYEIIISHEFDDPKESGKQPLNTMSIDLRGPGGREAIRDISEMLQSDSEEVLKNSFGSTWECLRKETRDTLISARTTLMYSRDVETLCIGVCNNVGKALETELYDRLFSGFIDYMKNEEGSNYSKWPVILLNEEMTDPKDKFSLGSLPYLFGKKPEGKYENLSGYEKKQTNDTNLKKNRDKFLATVMRSPDELKNIFPRMKTLSDCFTQAPYVQSVSKKNKTGEVYEKGSLVGIIKNVSKKYRNPDSHGAKDLLKLDDSAECYRLIAGKLESDEQLAGPQYGALKLFLELFKN